jgi:predicted RNA binding protein YcfA (HicA-like mRNA interferase family)
MNVRVFIRKALSKKIKLLMKILSGVADNNIAFNDLCSILLYLGFEERIKGSHHIFWFDNGWEIINLQPLSDGKAKSYQVKQVREIIIKYKLMEKIENE